jgi:hypothetical protein
MSTVQKQKLQPARMPVKAFVTLKRGVIRDFTPSDVKKTKDSVALSHKYKQVVKKLKGFEMNGTVTRVHMFSDGHMKGYWNGLQVIRKESDSFWSVV